MFTLSQRGRRKLVEAGVEFRNFLNPASILGAWVINYRNHRKIVVIDGKIAYTGGMNIGEEYISGGRRFRTWRDTHMRFTGEVVALLQSAFLADWFNSNGTVGRLEDYFQHQEDQSAKRFLPVQILCSGPDSDWYSIQQLYFNLIANADQKVLIQSPYFVPDDSIRIAMETAALSGVDVRLMMTGIPDKHIPFWAAHTYFDNLLSAGVKIYLYEKGFFHSKAVIIDDKIVTSGSCNMDVRSFFLDYELNAVFYDEKTAKMFSDQFEKDMENCILLTLEMHRTSGIPSKLRNSVCRIFSPLL
jgi:cardiolipin synthase